VTADRIVNEATRWGLSTRRSRRVIADVRERVADAVAAATAETAGLPPPIPTLVTHNSSKSGAFTNAEVA
jgi:hypothetical protein